MLYAFGIFEFDAGTGELRRSGRAVALEPQPSRALALLVSRAGDIVLREELAAHVWGSDTHVDFNRGLAYCIAEIRRALGDSADNPRFVQTLPKRGFRFIAPVQTVGVKVHALHEDFDADAGSVLRNGADAGDGTGTRDADAPPRNFSPSPRLAVTRLRRAAVVAALALPLAVVIWASLNRGGDRRPVIAVSVFDNETGDSRYDLAVGGWSDTVVDRLTQLGPERIGVVGNEAVLRMPRSERDLRRIAAETGAGFLVLAQLQQTDPGLHLLIHLIRLDDGTHLWTQRIPRPSDDGLEQLGEEAGREVEAAVRRLVIGE